MTDTKTKPHVFSRAVLLALFLTTAFAGTSCTSQAKRAKMDDARERTRAVAALDSKYVYTLQPGDELSLGFFYNAELNTQIIIRPDGRFNLPLIGEVNAAGRSITDLTAELKGRYEPLLTRPEVIVNVAAFGSQIAYVGGEVLKPGVVPLTSNMTALQSVLVAGGPRTTGNLKNVVIVRDQGTDTPLLLMIDLRKGTDELFAHEDLRLRPRDIVFIPKSGIAKANQFVQEYIRDLLPISSSFNLSYQFTDFFTP